MSIRVNFGCGKMPSKNWTNVDNSLAIKLANSPLLFNLAKLFKFLNTKQIENIEWNKHNKIEYMNASKSFPFKDNSVECIYTSHMLEHLSRKSVLNFLSESLRSLKYNGVIRIAVPDLELIVKNYLNSGDANNFMRDLFVEPPPMGTIKEKIVLLMTGYRQHQWMYDGKSLCNLLKNIGFRKVQIFKNGLTQISNPEGLDLNERSEQSVFVEGVK